MDEGDGFTLGYTETGVMMEPTHSEWFGGGNGKRFRDAVFRVGIPACDPHFQTGWQSTGFRLVPACCTLGSGARNETHIRFPRFSAGGQHESQAVVF
jgi:hypothetical protein